MNTPKNILVCRLSSLGDILLTTPVLRAIKQKYSDAKIDYLIKEEFAEVLMYNPNINKLIVYTKNQHSQIKDQLNEKYDLLIDLQNNFRSRNLTNNAAEKIFRFTKPSIRKYLLVNFKINLFPDIIPIPHRYAASIDNLKLDNEGLELHIPELINGFLNKDSNYIGICPGSKHYTKRWPEYYYIELGKLLIERGRSIVIFGGAEDSMICKRINEGIPESINLCNKNLLLETAADMKKCKLIICNDSGLMHTASAVGVPIVTIFGSSVKEFGFIPYNINNVILENKSLSCRPCSHVGLAKCPKRHFKCMNEIKPQQVLEEAIKLIKDL